MSAGGADGGDSDGDEGQIGAGAEAPKGPSGPGSLAEEEEWEAVPLSMAFTEVRLRMRRLPPSMLPEAGRTKSASSSAEPHKPKHTPMNRTWCVVEIGGHEGDEVSDFRWLEFFVGETTGHDRPSGDLPPGAWEPPDEYFRMEVDRWVSEAVLALDVGEAADFEPAEQGATAATAASAGGLKGRCRVRLLESARAADLLGDGSLMLRVLDPGRGGEKPWDLAQVHADWRVWFLRNGEEVLGRGGGHRFIIDEAKVMIAFELALKDMEEGSRACMRVSEDWGQGCLTLQVIAGAAVWVELILHEVKNELGAGEHEDVEQALTFAAEKKEQGNRSLASKTPADDSRALRRYQVGLKILEALLPAEVAAKLSKAPAAKKKALEEGSRGAPPGPLAGDAELPRVEALLEALRLNAAQAEIRREKWSEVVELCTLVLQMGQGGNPKAYYRRGHARAHLGEFQGALEDLRASAAASPSDAGTRKELARVEALYREHREKEKRSFGGLFAKMSQQEKDKEEKEETRKKALAEQEAKLEQERQKKQAEERKKQAEERKIQYEEEQAAKKAREEEEAKAKETAEANISATIAGQAEAAAPAVGGGGGAENEGEQLAKQSAEVAKPPPEAKPPVVQTEGRWTPMSFTPPPRTAEQEMQAQTQEIIEKLNKGDGTGPPRNFKQMASVTQEPEPVDYEVPSFLKGGKKKKAPK
mmetsp:Transcript_52539/g.170708  ORF Transcript_52539/g.170708 Transcript_52539/m.170708 type:complete len:701 (-) Transcript_52539:42-2144(-)